MSVARGFGLFLGVFVGTSIAALAVASIAAPWSRPRDVELEVQGSPLPAAGSSGVARQDVTVPRTDGTTARGWLVLPDGVGPRRAVVLVAGAGSSSRDDLIGLADEFARHGVAALTVDKRADASTLFTRDFDRLADDAVDAGRFLRDCPAIGSSPVDVVGFSEGGWVAPRAAVVEPGLFAAVILVSPSIVSPLAQAAWVVDGAIAGATDIMRRVAAAAVAGGRGFSDYLDADSDDALTNLDIPVYAVWGAEDTSAPVASAAARLSELVATPMRRVILAGEGHDPNPNRWVADALAWASDPDDAQGDPIRGVAPTVVRAAPAPPPAAFYLDPRAHALVALTAATAAVLSAHFRRKGHRP